MLYHQWPRQVKGSQWARLGLGLKQAQGLNIRPEPGATQTKSDVIKPKPNPTKSILVLKPGQVQNRTYLFFYQNFIWGSTHYLDLCFLA